MKQPTDHTRHLDPDDPRHGTYAGYVAHWKVPEDPCPACALAQSRYTKRRKYDADRGRPRRYPILGYRRRFEALQALGWNIAELAELLGTTKGALSNRVYRSAWISAANYNQMHQLYERICTTPGIGRYRNRTIRNAERKGYLPPLAWDDIDTDPEPPKPEKTGGITLAEYEFLIGCGESHEQALKRLGVSESAIEMARHRAGKVA